jgi:hypothetical protein
MTQTKTTRPRAGYERLSRGYLAAFACTLLGCLSVVAAINLLVDPYQAYRLIESPSLNAVKPTSRNRITKAEMARHENAEAIILGSSRAQVGMDPGAPEWGGLRTINLGLDGSTQYETWSAFRLASERGTLRTVVYLVDLFAFDDVRIPYSQDFSKSRFNPDLPAWEYHLENLIGWDATNYSFNSLGAWMGVSHRRLAAQRGFGAPEQLVALGFRPAMRLQLARDAPARGKARFRLSAAAMDSFRRIVRICRERDIRLFLGIPPIHAVSLELMRADGTWSDFEDWKRALAKVVAEENARAPQKEPVVLWDFTAYSGPCAEEIPPMGAANPHMRYHYDQGHFTPLFGELILRRMFGGPKANDADLSGVGVVLTPDTIDACFAQVRAERESYVRSHPAEVAEVRKAIGSP